MESLKGFKRCGFYLHEGWFFNYPFAVRAWKREDFSKAFRLLRLMGCDQVGIWPMFESVPMPLTESDAASLREFRKTVDDAHEAGLECWAMLCPNLTTPPEIAAKPWLERNPYPVFRNVRMEDGAEAVSYLAHRAKIFELVDNADAYSVIDGDPGGYPGAKLEGWLRVLKSDRAAIDRFGVDPARQRIVPWIWSGWGAKGVWKEPIEPFVRAEMEALKKGLLPEAWGLLPGRSHREGWANGRVNVALAEELGLLERSTLMCYEAIEFEPVPPSPKLQFDIIRSVLREEARLAGRVQGVFGNAQQPVSVLPNVFFFAKAAKDFSYLERGDEEILGDFASFLGGPAELLIPAWSCLKLGLNELSEELPARLRGAKLRGAAASLIPGGPELYLDILASGLESRIGLLKAIGKSAESEEEAAARLADGVAALRSWWRVHGYVGDGSGGEPFSWRFAESSQVASLREWAAANASGGKVGSLAARLLESRVGVKEGESFKLLKDLTGE